MNKAEYVEDLLGKSKETHKGIFMTGPSEIQLLEDNLPEEAYNDDNIMTYSLGNCRCASDGKAIKQFHGHARVPNDATQVSLGHETLQVVLKADEKTGLKAGDIVFVTPGHSSVPINPITFETGDDGVLPSLGYSYRYLGGLREYNMIPISAIDFVRSQGFGNLFNVVDKKDTLSIVSLAHSEPFACNYGTNKFIFTKDSDDNFVYGVPPKAKIAYLAGTARMAMINLTIVAGVSDEDLPSVVYITGSQKKLDELKNFDLIKKLEAKGVVIELIDRTDSDIINKLQVHGKPSVVWTNFANADVYKQATAIIAEGGNINNYAGAADPTLVLEMEIAKAKSFADFAEEAKYQINSMHHNIQALDLNRHLGLSKIDTKVLLIGLDSDRENAYKNECGTAIISTEICKSGKYTDVFIAGEGDDVAKIYLELEPLLAKNAAVNFIDGNTTIQINSRLSHYTTRHQICGDNTPWGMTNTSEPHSDDMALQGENLIDFDWMVKGVCGLNHTIEMMDIVEKEAPFGSFFVFTDLADLPWLEVDKDIFAEAANNAKCDNLKNALQAASDEMSQNGNVWSRKVEEVMYDAMGITYPLSI